MSSKIFNIFSEYIRRHPVKSSFATIPPLVLIIGGLQKELGILPSKTMVFSCPKKIVKDPDFGFYTSPK